jgi:molybdate transport system substrate-binding protein
MFIRRRLLAMLAAIVLTPGAGPAATAVPAIPADTSARSALLVFAAASLTDVLGELSPMWEKAAGVPVKLSFAASSILARQIEAGGAADIFIAADQEWMDYLQARNLLDAASRRNLAANRLVLIAPAGSTLKLRIEPRFKLAAALGKGRLASGDPDVVPAGRYARSALMSLGAWDDVSGRLARADNVRAALMFVARGEAPLGIVYATDARVDSDVRIVDTFPESSHPPITYPGAVVNGARSQAGDYLEFLAGKQAQATWRRYGFMEIRK